MKGGDSNIYNLRPMHWENNRSKSDDYPHYDSAGCAKDDSNIKKVGHFVVNEDLKSVLDSLYNVLL